MMAVFCGARAPCAKSLIVTCSSCTKRLLVTNKYTSMGKNIAVITANMTLTIIQMTVKEVWRSISRAKYVSSDMIVLFLHTISSGQGDGDDVNIVVNAVVYEVVLDGLVVGVLLEVVDKSAPSGAFVVHGVRASSAYDMLIVREPQSI